MLQTPVDDSRFVSLAITEVRDLDRHRAFDWACFMFGNSEINSDYLKSLLCTDPFPSDFAPLAPDFMFLPVTILKQQTQTIATNVKDLLKIVLEEKKNILSKNPRKLNEMKVTLFWLEKLHLEQQYRWLFAQELAENLVKCFAEILRRHASDTNRAAYSKTLRQRVETQQTLLKMLRHDFNTISAKIATQHQMVPSFVLQLDKLMLIDLLNRLTPN